MNLFSIFQIEQAKKIFGQFYIDIDLVITEKKYKKTGKELFIRIGITNLVDILEIIKDSADIS